MNNRRGIFLTNIVSKVWERVIMNKIRKSVTLTVEQNGAQKGRSTTDNLLTILAVVNERKRLKQNTCMCFADAYKCFDKLWLKDCLVDLEACGVREKEISYIYELNRRSHVIVDTPAGETEQFTLGEIVKQGTVLGPYLCCASTQRVNSLGPQIKTVIGPELEVG